MKALIAGFDEELRELVLGYMAELESCDVETIATHGELISILSSGRVDLIIVGDGLVEGDPGKMIAGISGTSHRTAIIHITGLNSEEYALSAIRLGMDDVVSVDELEKTSFFRLVRRVVERSESRIQMVSQISDFVLTHSFDGIIAVDLQYRIVLWNHGMERMFGKKRRDVLGKIISDVLPFEGLEKDMLDAFEGRSFAGEQMRYQARGERRFYQPYFSSLTNRSDRVIGVMVNFRDLTDSIEKDSQVESLKERMNQLADTVPGMVWMSDAEGSRNFFSKSWLDFTGLDAYALSFDGWLVTMHPQDRRRYNNILQRALAERRSFHVEYRIRRHDHVFRKQLDSGNPIFSADGTFAGFIGSCIDISASGTTHHKLVPTKLKDSGSRVMVDPQTPHFESSTMENAPIGLWKLDRELVIVKASPAAASQLGQQSNDLVGLSFCDIVDSVPREKIVPALEANETVQLPRQKMEILKGGEKKEVLLDIAAWPIKDKDGRASGLYVSTIEVDDRMVSRQKEDFVATLVHDLKTPLIGADRTLEAILNGTLGEVDEGQFEVLAMLHKSNQSLLRMVQNLIEVYRYDYSEPQLTFEAAFLFDLASDCCRELSAVAESKNIGLEVNLPMSQGRVQVDALAIRRVISNLIDNAIKFTLKGGTVRVWGEETPNKVTIHVKDTGIGISQDELSKVFERFWRSQKSKGQSVGTGLGLYLCKQIIDAHEGDIKVSSVEGESTAFSITLARE